MPDTKCVVYPFGLKVPSLLPIFYELTIVVSSSVRDLLAVVITIRIRAAGVSTTAGIMLRRWFVVFDRVGCGKIIKAVKSLGLCGPAFRDARSLVIWTASFVVLHRVEVLLQVAVLLQLGHISSARRV